MNLKKRIFYSQSVEIYMMVTDDEWRENCYMILEKERKEMLIIDPGYGLKLDEEIVKSFCNGYILLTHPHHDHLSSAKTISDIMNMPCVVNPQDKNLFLHAPTFSRVFAKRRLELPTNIKWMDKYLIDELKHRGITVEETPGHTKGGLTFLLANIAFTGDTLFYKKIGRTDLPGADRELLFQSIDSLLNKLNNGETICPGHGDTWNVEDAQRWWKENKNAPEELSLFER